MTKRQKLLSEIDAKNKEAALLQEAFDKHIAELEAKRLSVQEQIDKLIAENNLFCGVIMTEDMLLNLIKLRFMSPGVNMQIPFELFIKDENEESQDVSSKI